MNSNLFKPRTIEALPQRIPANLEATHNGQLIVSHAGTYWQFKLLVSVGQIIQLVPGQPVTIVGVEDTLTLIIEV